MEGYVGQRGVDEKGPTLWTKIGWRQTIGSIEQDKDELRVV